MIPCAGCTAKHLSTAGVYLKEIGGKISGTEDRQKLSGVLGELTHAEGHAVSGEIRDQIRSIRKRVEAGVVEGTLPEVSDEITRKAAENLELIQKNPELCPTCELGLEGVEHV